MKALTARLWNWWLDYLYVAYWQVHDFFRRDDPALYLEGQEGKRPIVVIPGIYESWQFMLPLIRRLHARGHAVHVIRGMGYNTGRIPKMAELVQQYVSEHKLRGAVLLAHSKGGLIGKYAMVTYDSEQSICHMIAINTPFSGSRYAYLVPAPQVWTFWPKGRTIRTLRRNIAANERITSIYAGFDPHIPEGSYLEHAENVKLPVVGHFRPIASREVWQAAAEALEGLEAKK